MLQFLQPFEKEIFARGMRKMDEAYDPAVRMLTSYRGKNGYHSRLSDCTVHEIRGSFSYAYLLLCRDEAGDRERAADILYRVIPLQDINPARNTYGIWQYFLEEDLEEMNPPDWNWADFNGKDLLRMLAEHGDKLSADLKARMQDSVCHACRAIIKRDVQPVYTNISIMGSYVTLLAGELFNRHDFFDYGKKRLTKLYEYNMAHENFSEFNSPTYTFICLGDLSALVRDVADADCHRMASELADLAWGAVAQHFHPATAQLAGPHYRAYSLLLPDTTKLAIERALGYKVSLLASHDTLSTTDFTTEMHCPDKYLPFFADNVEERVLDQTFSAGQMAYTYMSRNYTLGSLHCDIAWNQHRNVLGFFGTKENPVAVNLKCLHDGWDYCSAMMTTVQEKNRTLTGVCFVTDGGDTHCCLDMVKNAAIHLRDLRLRWVLEGGINTLQAKQTENGFVVTEGNTGTTLTVCFPYAVFGDKPVRYEITREAGRIGLDAILYSGEETDLHFDDPALSRAAILTMLEISDAKAEHRDAFVAEKEETSGEITLTWKNLTVSVPLQPAKTAVVRPQLHLFRDGKPYRPAY